MQLLRQIEVLGHYHFIEYSNSSKEIKINFENECDIAESLANFGRIDFNVNNGFSYENQVFKTEDYQNPEMDHISLYKYLEKSYSANFNSTSNALKLLHNNLNQSTVEDNSFDIIDTSTEEIFGVNDETSSQSFEANTILECVEKEDAKLCMHNVNLNREDEEEHKLNVVIVTKDIINVCDTDNDISTTENDLTENLVKIKPNSCKCRLTISDIKENSCTKSDDKNIEPMYSSDNDNVSLKEINSKQAIQVQHWMKQIKNETEVEPNLNHMECRILGENLLHCSD